MTLSPSEHQAMMVAEAMRKEDWSLQADMRTDGLNRATFWRWDNSPIYRVDAETLGHPSYSLRGGPRREMNRDD